MAASVASPVWDFAKDEPHMRAARVGAQAGAEQIGACLYELGPGAQTGPLHAHHANEELLIVLSGSPVIRRAGGAREQLEPGSVVSFPASRDGAHAIEHDGPGIARLLVISTMMFPDVVEHLDTDKLVVLMGPPADDTNEFLAFDRRDAVDLRRKPNERADAK